ncbi:hypothetical protein [Sphingomonas sp. UYP23]
MTLDDGFDMPAYLERGDVHRVPGGNPQDDGSPLRRAAMDRGGAAC